MTSRERMRLALSHEEADRIPILDTLWTATVRHWQQKGRYIYHSDHSIPDNVSFDQYRRGLELVEQYGRY